jgi:hypothetical protein
VNVSDQECSAADFLHYIWPEPRMGIGLVGADVPDGRYQKGIDLTRPDALEMAAAFVVELRLMVALPIYRPGPHRYDDVTVLRSHAGAIRFAPGVEPATVQELAAPPDIFVWMGDDANSWGVWGYFEPVGGPELIGTQTRERGLCGGDPTWSASASAWVAVPGVTYKVNGTERRATEWPGVRA